jgi:Big-like domain-containing protein
VTATVKDEFGNATPGIVVRFSVTGAVTTSGSQTTNASGEAQFCYTGPGLPGSDLITAYADTNGDNTKQATEPADTATKEWVLPSSTAGCKVTYGGRITARNGDKATFGGNAKATGLQGEEEYQDHGSAADLNVHSLNVQAVVCSADGKSASIFGKATVNGSGSFDYRIDVTDNAEPGAGTDTYRIRLSNGYDSGTQTLEGGNVQLH